MCIMNEYDFIVWSHVFSRALLLWETEATTSYNTSMGWRNPALAETGVTWMIYRNARFEFLLTVESMLLCW